jgi:ABC-type branched-subunit amino acid transport system substrate-binding protein
VAEFIVMSALAANALVLAGRYRLIAEIGRGGMADVYLAVNRTGMGGFQKLVVIKVLRSNLAQEEDFLKMFLDEARLAAKLNHPNVVQTNEVGEDHGRYFIAMEYLEGQTLNRVVRHIDSPLRFPRSLRLHALTRVLAGLHYAHELRDYDGTPLAIVHRDVSPSNVFVTYEGQVKLVDFGIAKAMDSSLDTRAGVFKGKTGYIAPEQLNGQRNVDRRADVYAIGVMLWELVTGERMWRGVAPSDVLRRTSSGDLPSLRAVAPDLPTDLERICRRALAYNPDDRYATAAAIETELEAHLAAAGPVPADRDIGLALKAMFEDERARLRLAIEDQLTEPEVPSAVGLPVILAGAGGSSATTTVSGVEALEVEAPAVPPITTPLAQAPLVESPLWSAPPPRRRTGRAFALAAAGVVAASAVYGAFVLGSHLRAAPPVEAAAAALRPPAPPVRGVSDGEVVLGMSGAFSGPARELGNRMKLGLDTAFEQANERGGVAGRRLRLIALDDGYEGPRAGENMRELLGPREVFAVVGNVGTPTAAVAAPYASSHQTIFFGAFTGSKILRQEPPDRYVFNYRASYEEETATMVHYLVDQKKIPPAAIAVFAQHDAYGDAGFEGVAKTLRKYGRPDADILRVNYERNTTEVDGAVRDIAVALHGGRPVKAIVMVATYRPAARFIQKIRDRGLDPVFLNVSFVGTNALAEELHDLGGDYASGVIVTQVVPPYDSGGTGIIRYREALARFHPDQEPDFVSLEGYVAGSLFVEGLRRAGRDLTTENLVDALESIRDYDIGIGTVLGFGLSEHQASHKVWGTVLDAHANVQALDMQ